MAHAILVATVAFGIFATMLSAVLFAFFTRSRHRVGRAVAFMLAGETATNIIFTSFATLELFGALPDFPVMLQTAMRWFALSIVVASTIHLASVVRKVHG